jgi:LuxR family quorum sensing-dependent transcriptional regulator
VEADAVSLSFDPGHLSLRRRATTKVVLTAREIEVLRWVANGKSAWEVGEILHIAKRTVDAHVQAAVRKLGAGNRTHAVAIAIHDGIIGL